MTFASLFSHREISAETRFEVLERDCYACVYCKKKVDFYSARFTEAWHSDKNMAPSAFVLRTTCDDCDCEKGARDENQYWFWKILKNLRATASEARAT